ncbi:ribonuclease P protein component [Bacteroidia bacterium]|nr:ribonuclease P protein component [Bacteroidia bacterium]
MKNERIFLQREIDILFESGNSLKVFPLRVTFWEQTLEAQQSPVSILISVPKKRFKRAVHRNRVKRLIRESYRLNKTALTAICAQKNMRLLIAFVYISDTIVDFHEMEAAVQKALTDLQEQLA